QEHGQPPCLTTAWVYPIPLSLSFSQNPVKGGTNVTVTVNMNGLGYTDPGLWVYLSSAPTPPPLVGFPVIPGPQTTATWVTPTSYTFTMATVAVLVNTAVTITAR